MNDLREGKELDELALHGVHYGFKPVVSPQLLVDAVKVVAQSLEADLQALGDLRRGPQKRNTQTTLGRPVPEKDSRPVWFIPKAASVVPSRKANKPILEHPNFSISVYCQILK